MKKILFGVILIVLSISVKAQDINLETLPKIKRDSILLSRAKEAILRYGESQYYNVERAPLIRYFRNFDTEDRGLINMYSITYLYDPTKFAMNMPFSVSVSIIANTGKVYRIMFGNGYGAYNLDIRVETDHFPYRQYATTPALIEKITAKQQVFINEAASYEASGDIFTEGIDNSGGNLGDIGGTKPKKP